MATNSKYKKVSRYKMLVCIKYHLSNIWSSIHVKVKQHWGSVEQTLRMKKKACVFDLIASWLDLTSAKKFIYLAIKLLEIPVIVNSLSVWQCLSRENKQNYWICINIQNLYKYPVKCEYLNKISSRFFSFVSLFHKAWATWCFEYLKTC